MVKVATSPAATVLAEPVVLGGSSLTLGRRKLIPSLEHVTFTVPTPTPMIAAIRLQVSSRAPRIRSGLNLLPRRRAFAFGRDTSS